MPLEVMTCPTRVSSDDRQPTDPSVMAGLVPAIHDLNTDHGKEFMDAPKAVQV